MTHRHQALQRWLYVSGDAIWADGGVGVTDMSVVHAGPEVCMGDNRLMVSLSRGDLPWGGGVYVGTGLAAARCSL